MRLCYFWAVGQTCQSGTGWKGPNPSEFLFRGCHYRLGGLRICCSCDLLPKSGLAIPNKQSHWASGLENCVSVSGCIIWVWQRKQTNRPTVSPLDLTVLWVVSEIMHASPCFHAPWIGWVPPLLTLNEKWLDYPVPLGSWLVLMLETSYVRNRRISQDLQWNRIIRLRISDLFLCKRNS